MPFQVIIERCPKFLEYAMLDIGKEDKFNMAESQHQDISKVLFTDN